MKLYHLDRAGTLDVSKDSELIRRVMFPQCQSRYTALFAVKSIEDFSSWPELVPPSGDTSNVKIV